MKTKSNHRIVIELPPGFYKRVRRLTDWLEIPPSHIVKELTPFVVNDQFTKEERLWMDYYVYPNREIAERVALKFFHKHPRWTELEMTFESSGKVRTVVFTNSNPRPLTKAEEIEHAEALGRLYFGPPYVPAEYPRVPLPLP